MMLNINGDGLNAAYEDMLNHSPGFKLNMTKPHADNVKNVGGIDYMLQPKKKKSNSAQPSPHRNPIKTAKGANHPNALQVGMPSRPMNEPRPYSAKNSSYGRKKENTLIKMLKNETDLKNKSFSNKQSKKGEMKRTTSK